MRIYASALGLALLVHVGGCSCQGNPGKGNGGDLAAPTGDGAPSGDAAVVCLAGLSSITLSPSGMMGTVDGASAAPVDFTAIGTFADGHMTMLDPAALSWSAARGDDTPPGTIADGQYQPNPAAGGTITITATDGCIAGTTTITLKLVATLGTPADPTAWGGTPSTAGTLPTIVYPSDQTRFPRNIYRTLFQWRTGGYAQFRLTFEGPNATVTIFTDGAQALCMNKTPAAGCWEADETAWSFIAASNAGQTVTWTLDALDTSTMPATVRRAPPITIGFSKRDVVGAIFYWSTTSAGVRRANIRDAVPENYITGKPGTVYPNPTGTVKCVACHVVSRDGKYMVAPVQTAAQSLWVMGVTKSPPPDALVTSIANTGGHGFATISPDDNQVVAAWGGAMWSLDRATGTKIVDLPLNGKKATQPDWSPDNTQLAFAEAAGDAPAGANLDVMAYGASGWGAITTRVAAAGLSNLFPMFSPDGKWIAYSRGKGGHDDLTAQLWIVQGQGTPAPIELLNANRVVSNVLGDGQTENSQPTWAPPGDLDWVAFNSQREYGVVQPKGRQQIWVAAIDLSKAQPGVDPSYPAFRLQFQGLAEDNHRAFWTLDVRDDPDGGAPPPDMAPPGDMARMCVATGMTCDPVLDACCDTGAHCDTADNGATYTCIAPIP